ncbi:MAG: hypothetical protein NVSMB65_16870 [Chloroflexota bacterium]
MQCRECGAQNPAGNRFCASCGAALPLRQQDEEASAGARAAPSYAERPTAARGVYGADPDPAEDGAPRVATYGQMGAAPVQGYTIGGAAPVAWSRDQLAGFGRRVLVSLIDLVVLAIAGGILRALHLGALAFPVDLAYLIGFWATTGQTVGCMALHVKVVRADGQPLTAMTALIRYVGYIIACIPFLLGLLWVAWDPMKQGWHDKIAGTVVVRAS